LDLLFTTWAYRFVVLEVSAKLGRHYWRQHPTEHLAAEDWDRLPDRLQAGPGEDAEHTDLVKAVRQAVDETLTEHQRYPGVAAHLAACGPCCEDFRGLLAAVTADR